GDSRLSSPRQGTDPALNNPSAADESIRLRLVSVQRVISGPYGHQRLRIRQGWLLPPTPPEETGD
ncbi:MAG: hypothetical protein JXN59_00540, partial [Anaerolineae bacterium]|nr:hypothetical protein [Anaerolineae bacterium]